MTQNSQYTPPVVIYTDPELKQQATIIAERLQTIVCGSSDPDLTQSHSGQLSLLPDPSGEPEEFLLKLTIITADSSLSHQIDFNSNRMSHRKVHGGGKDQELVRACGLKKNRDLRILDATAGLGTDSFVLACNTAQITMAEQHPVLAIMLENALLAASRVPALSDIVSRMQFIPGNSLDLLNSPDISKRFDVVYLDPMYPLRKKNSAKVKKEMQIVQHLSHNYPNQGDQLLQSALESGVKRIVVKRPSGAEPLLQLKPHSTIKSVNTRYDLYI